MVRLAGEAVGREHPGCRGCSAASRRSIPTSLQHATIRACSSTSTSSRCTGSRSTGTTGRSTSGRQARRDPGGDGAADLGVGGRRLHLRRRGGAGFGLQRTAELLCGRVRSHPLVQPLRPAARLAGDDASPRGGRLVVLPALLHGPAARGRHAEAGAALFRPVRARAGHLPVVPLRGPPAGRRRGLAAPAGREAPAHRASAGPTASGPGCGAWFDRQMQALEEFDTTVTFCFTPEHGIEPHHTSPPRDRRSSPSSARG
jgi:hypothetical protein